MKMNVDMVSKVMSVKWGGVSVELVEEMMSVLENWLWEEREVKVDEWEVDSKWERKEGEGKVEWGARVERLMLGLE